MYFLSSYRDFYFENVIFYRMSQHDNLEMIPDNSLALKKHFSVSTILSMMFNLILIPN